MIKILIHFIKLAVAAVTALLFASCNINFNAVKGSGNVTTEKRAVSKDFTGVRVAQGIDLTVIQSSDFGIEIEADDNLQALIETKVKDNVLVISSTENISRGDNVKNVTVRLPQIDQILASSGASAKSNGVLRSESLSLESSSGSSIDVEVEASELTTKASSGSHQEISGKALTMLATTSSGSHIKSSNLLVNKVEARASSGSSLVVNPALQLSAKASSGSSIGYIRTPEKIEKVITSGGSIYHN